MKKAITFADFQAGAVLGEHIEAYDRNLVNAWQRIFGSAPADGANSAAEAASIAMVLAMRAFLTVVAPRPPGNVHARQQFRLDTLPQPGEQVRTVVSCVDKQVKRERLYVDLRVQGSGDDGRALFTGCMSLIWAA
ncbi:hypothetical protein [Lacisediminimonas profundi]|uniref:hypothetical protein n=1 Tax=Lacisediminimonas profundi TaxID=2603856 RepID=UPI00124B3DFB|nr:hypothetical protein [Lacisediminimonas profundi]